MKSSTYPPQFWLIFWGLILSSAGISLIGPFLMIYMSERLQRPLAEVASALAVAAGTELLTMFFAGPLVDRLGRKPAMVAGLGGLGLVYFLLSRVDTLAGFMAVMALSGLSGPFYRVGADAMLVDLIPIDRRPAAYAVWRVGDNVGFALGPAVGGFIASLSRTAAFYGAAASLLGYGLALAWLARETRPTSGLPLTGQRPGGSWRQMRHNRRYLFFIGSMFLYQLCITMLWSLLGVYAKRSYGVPERLYGFIPATNALMVVLFQVSLTRLVKGWPNLRAVSVGVGIYALGVVSVAFGRGFWSFWASFVLVTIGEMLFAPMASAYVADAAPPDQRGRYFGLYSVAQGVGRGLAPVIGGNLLDRAGGQALWSGAGTFGLLGALGFAVLNWRQARQPARRNPA